MAGVGNSNLTLIDLASRMEKGSVAKQIIEILDEKNDVLQDIVWTQCNDGSGHRTTVRTGLPTGTWRKLNYGVTPKKSTTAQIRDACGMLENYSKVDADILARAKDKAALRLSEERPFMEGMRQDFMNTFIYGDTTVNPERFMGLAPRFNSLSAANGQNIVSGGGAGSDNTSIWLVVFGETTVSGLYPEGSQAGLHMKDLGEDTVQDADGGEYQAFRSHFKWDCGLTVRDWRYVVRIANVDVSDLVKTAATGADLTDLMVQALELVQDLNGRAVFMCNRTIRSMLRRQMLNKSNVLLSYDEHAGKKVLTFDGIPVRRCDAILNTEATVS
jgi:hypothetical protein